MMLNLRWLFRYLWLFSFVCKLMFHLRLYAFCWIHWFSLFLEVLTWLQTYFLCAWFRAFGLCWLCLRFLIAIWINKCCTNHHTSHLLSLLTLFGFALVLQVQLCFIVYSLFLLLTLSLTWAHRRFYTPRSAWNCWYTCICDVPVNLETNWLSTLRTFFAKNVFLRLSFLA